MIERSLTLSFIPGMVIGVIYLSIILWWLTDYTSIDLIEAITDTIVGSLQGVTIITG